ncbi:MAG: terminase family protein [Sphingopyxis sp.]|uniref:DNA-packaging protein n=1 Tax=Sphingopyxis sp. TaxID=1908224 RepID=UPI002ABC7F6A|nr:terminase family protein [Sphingopyxis sp.]MDZ3830351.1 terminase family protein [Sphingopyxis sp.]
MADKLADDAPSRRSRSDDVLGDMGAMTPGELRFVLRGLNPAQMGELTTRWFGFEHDGQREPPGEWRIWLIRAGRGFGKTRAGAEWVSELARALPAARIALVAATQADGQRVMVEGPSGLIAVARPGEVPRWYQTRRELRFPNGAVATLYSAEAGEELRGPEHHAAWCDELAKWRHGTAVWDNLMLGLRLGERPRAVVTTTPRVTAAMRKLMTAPGMVETRGRTRENPFLPANFVVAMIESYGGTRLGRQELDGDMLEDAEGALWTRALIERCRVTADGVGKPVRVAIGVDPPATSHGDACGIIVAVLLRDGRVAVVEDASVEKAPPHVWAQAVAAAAARWGADRVVAESNMGGEMVEATLRAAMIDLPVVAVRAGQSKVRRAEPVAIAYERGAVVHAGGFAALEDELCGLQTGGGYAGPGRSPDRADACVWAVTELLAGMRKGRGPGVRRI